MVCRRLLAATAVIWFLCPGRSPADETRYVRQAGTLYRETRQTVQRPVVETRIEESTRTVYREELSTELREEVRTYVDPVIEYRCEPYLVNRWNPLATPYLAYRMVPRTRWQCCSETVRTPVTCRRLVPVTETVRRPVTTCRMVSEERTTRVAVSVASPAAAPIAAMAARQPAATVRYEEIGGVARLDKDPPRQGIRAAWRPSGTLR